LFADPEDLPEVLPLYPERPEGLWFQVEVTDHEVLGTLYVVRDGQAEPEEWTLLDRPIFKFGFCKE